MMISYKDQEATKRLNQQGRFNVERNFTAPAGFFDGANIPAQFLTRLSPYTVQQLLRPMTAEQLIGFKSKELDWSEDRLQVPYIEKAGEVTAYSDFAPATTADINIKWSYVGHLRFSNGIEIGDLEQEKMARVGTDLQSAKYEAAMELLAQAMNKIYWYGYQTGSKPSENDLHGILTAPYLVDKVTLIKKIAYSSYGITDANRLVAMIYEKFADQTGNRVNRDVPINIGFSVRATARLNSLLNGNSSATLWQTLKDSFPNANFMTCPELDKCDNGKDMLVAVCPQIPGAGTPTAKLGFSEEYLLGTVVRNHSSYTMKVSSGCTGFICLQPSGIVRFTDTTADN